MKADVASVATLVMATLHYNTAQTYMVKAADERLLCTRSHAHHVLGMFAMSGSVG
jgi:hypothetical protein